jgi:hypothetical protein
MRPLCESLQIQHKGEWARGKGKMTGKVWTIWKGQNPWIAQNASNGFEAWRKSMRNKGVDMGFLGCSVADI